MDMKKMEIFGVLVGINPEFDLQAVITVLKRAELDSELKEISKWQKSLTNTRLGHWIYSTKKMV